MTYEFSSSKIDKEMSLSNVESAIGNRSGTAGHCGEIEPVCEEMEENEWIAACQLKWISDSRPN